ncbi:MAG: YifB family Mg chelatase-like AAA ATPase [bacterium JZ-2024 1]
MTSRIYSGTLIGIDGVLIEVETDLMGGDNEMVIVGLPDAAVKEAQERVRSALRNSGFGFPRKRAIINLAPAAIRKEGSAFDLPIALSILAEDHRISDDMLKDLVVVGELSLEGKIRPIPGVLGITLMAREQGKSAVLVPATCEYEATMVTGITVYSAADLNEAVKIVNGEMAPVAPPPPRSFEPRYDTDFSEIRGLVAARRAMELAAAGAHNMIMVGPPGSGKSMLAQRLPTILPSLTKEESLEVTKIYSAAGLLNASRPLILERPFRAPHHTISAAGLAGGGTNPRPGEISLAHHGVLFMDEFPLFSREALELLRAPLEDGQITIARAAGSITYPAKFQIVAAMNPCPCGFYGDTDHECRCTPVQIRQYLRRVSGPLMDRFDIAISVPRLEYRDWKGSEGEPSSVIRDRICRVREIQERRFSDAPFKTNSRIPSRYLKTFCPLPPDAESLLEAAVKKYGLTGRGIAKVLRLSRTIADANGSNQIRAMHLSEALQYRANEVVALFQ